MPLPERCGELSIQDLRLLVHLGCSEQERAVRQEVRVSLLLRLPDVPAVFTDELNGTVCYGDLCAKVTRHLEGTPFHLIERMAGETYELTKKIVGQGVGVQVVIWKVSPPVDNLSGGARFRWGDQW